MYSQRVGNYEFGNTENKKGWHTADGMLYLYNQDFAQFDEGYWATTVSYTHLKGTYGHLGEGTLLRIFDPGLITLPRLREYLLDTAATHNIPYQYFVSKGGTDAGAAHTTNNGVPSTVIGVCGRYIHTHQTMFSIADYEAAREMLLQALRGLDKSTVNTIVYGK